MKLFKNNHKLILLALILFLACPAFAQSGLKVGAAKVEITPKTSDLQNSTDIIRDHLYVKAIYIENGANSAVLASVDAGAVHNIDSILNVSSTSTGCLVENYVVTATHTHSGNTGGLFGGAPTAETIGSALVKAVDMAKSSVAPARVGYGTTQVDLNVNRDNYNEWQEWRQEPNPNGPSDKTLSVLEFLGEDDVPIAVYLNYAMHPVNFFLSGVISADFPGDATTYIEEMFDNKTVALFTQGASGDQNPKLAYSPIFRDGSIKAVMPPHQPPNQGAPHPAMVPREAVSKENLAAHKKTIARKSDYVHMLGTMIGSSAVKTMLYDIEPKEEASIWTGQKTVTCPGRIRLDNSKRENYDPGYKEGPDVTIQVGLLKIGDVNLVTVNGEVYTKIGQRLKEESPASNTMLVTLANGFSNSGYIYSNEASYHQTFQVLGSRLQPGYAENGIVNAAQDLLKLAEK